MPNDNPSDLLCPAGCHRGYFRKLNGAEPDCPKCKGSGINEAKLRERDECNRDAGYAEALADVKGLHLIGTLSGSGSDSFKKKEAQMREREERAKTRTRYTKEDPNV